MRCLFTGVGSIAVRHIKNLKKIMGNDVLIDVFHFGRSGQAAVQIGHLIQKEYYGYEEVPNTYDVIFITNPTMYHVDTLKKFHGNGKDFFIEKPLCTQEQAENLTLDFLHPDRVYYVACPLRYTEIVQYIKKNIKNEDVLAVRSISSSYLPEWRQKTDYRKTYSAKRELGGGVSLDLVHEWDYICYLFGIPQKVTAVTKKVSDLEIDTEDIALYIGEYADKTVEIHLDYIGRSPIRKMEILTKEDTVCCDFLESSVWYQRSGERIEFGQDRNSFQLKEMETFLQKVKDRDSGLEDMKIALDVVRLSGGVIV